MLAIRRKMHFFLGATAIAGSLLLFLSQQTESKSDRAPAGQSTTDVQVEPITARKGGIKIYSKNILVHPYQDFWKNHPPLMDEFEPMEPLPVSSFKSTSGFWVRYDFAVPDPGQTYYLDTRYYYRESYSGFLTCYDDFQNRPPVRRIDPIIEATPSYKIETVASNCSLIIPSRLPYYQTSGARLTEEASYYEGMQELYRFYSATFAILILISIYALGLTVYSRNHIAMLYFLSLPGYILYQGGVTGYIVSLGWTPEAAHFSIHGVVFWQIFFLLFVTELYESVKPNRLIRYSARSLAMVSALLLIPMAIVHPNIGFVIIEHHFYVFLVSVLLLTLFGLFFRGKLGVAVFLSFLWVTAGILIFALTNVAVLPLNIWTKHAPLLGTTIEMVFLSVFLGLRMRQIQSSRFRSDLSVQAGAAVERKARGYQNDLENHLLGRSAREIETALGSVLRNCRSVFGDDSPAAKTLARIRQQNRLFQDASTYGPPGVPHYESEVILALALEEIMAGLPTMQDRRGLRYHNHVPPDLITHLDSSVRGKLSLLMDSLLDALAPWEPKVLTLQGHLAPRGIQVEITVQTRREARGKPIDPGAFKPELEALQEKSANLAVHDSSACLSLSFDHHPPGETGGSFSAAKQSEIEGHPLVTLLSNDPVITAWLPRMAMDGLRWDIRSSLQIVPESSVFCIDLSGSSARPIGNLLKDARELLDSLTNEQTSILLLPEAPPLEAMQELLDPVLDRIIVRPCTEQDLRESLWAALQLGAKLKRQRSRYLQNQSHSEQIVLSRLQNSVGQQLHDLRSKINLNPSRRTLEELSAGIDEASDALRQLLAQMQKRQQRKQDP